MILDARWSGRGKVDEQCSGYCAAVMVHNALSATRMHDIFRFAAERVEGSIVCARGKHGSVDSIAEYCENSVPPCVYVYATLSVMSPVQE